MYLKQVSINNLRNIKEIKLSLPEGLVILTGRNGQGKTNILESIFLLSHARSFREQKNEYLIRNSCSQGSVEGLFHLPGHEAKIRIVLENNNRHAFINGKKCQRLSELAGYVHFVTFSFNDLQILSGTPSERRLFLDKFIFNMRPSYLSILRDYRRILKQRNVVLMRLNQVGGNSSELDVWDEHLINKSVEIYRYRFKVFQLINNLISEKYSVLSKLEEKLQVCYKTNLYNRVENKGFIVSPHEVKLLLKKKINSQRQQEIHRGFTLSGPHRDDFFIEINNRNVHHFSSQGEVRSSIIALKLVEIDLFIKQRGFSPILLFDDVLSELDLERAKDLMNGLMKAKQTLISTTSLDILKSIAKEAMIFEVENGEILGSLE